MVKTKKVQIPKALKETLWDKHYGENARNGKCLCCSNTQISITKYEAGHVIAEAEGGEAKLDNLKPICSTCNGSMGAKNMEVFMEACGFVKPENWDGFGVEKKVENVVKEEVVEQELVVEKAKIISCDVCKKTFTRPYNLKIHKAKKFACISNPKECEFCDKTFSKQSNKIRHLKDNSCKQEQEEYYKNKIKNTEARLKEERQIIDKKLKEIEENKIIKI
jgi:hypothetical protein